MPDIKTLTEYRDYERTVAEFIARESISFLSTGTRDIAGGDSEPDSEPDAWFSWSPCECCECTLGGNREHLYARDSNGDLVQYQICSDCVYYVNYGRLDDEGLIIRFGQLSGSYP